MTYNRRQHTLVKVSMPGLPQHAHTVFRERKERAEYLQPTHTNRSSLQKKSQRLYTLLSSKKKKPHSLPAYCLLYSSPDSSSVRQPDRRRKQQSSHAQPRAERSRSLSFLSSFLLCFPVVPRYCRIVQTARGSTQVVIMSFADNPLPSRDTMRVPPAPA